MLLEGAQEVAAESLRLVFGLADIVAAVLDADAHEGADDGAADFAGAGQAAGEGGRDAGDEVVLDSELLAHGQ